MSEGCREKLGTATPHISPTSEKYLMAGNTPCQDPNRTNYKLCEASSRPENLTLERYFPDKLPRPGRFPHREHHS